MISTAGLETNFLNPELTWKTVSKGNRKATRRTRKPVAKNLMVGMEIAGDSRKRAEDTTVSESEKPGQRVNGKIEHVPIKKRRFNFRSPSPPPRLPSHIEVVRHGSAPNLTENRLLLEVYASSGSGGEISDSVNGKFDYKEDFSGIEMLADAACSNSFDADVDQPNQKPVKEESLQEENDIPTEESVASLETGNPFPRDLVVEDRIHCSFQDTTTATAQNQKDNKTVEMSVPRLHWDLNVVMDAWEPSCEPRTAGSQTEDVEGKLQVLEDCETEKKIEDVKHNDIADIVVSSEVHEKTNASSDDLRGLSNGSDREDNQLEASSCPDRSCDECCVDSKASSQVVSLYPCIDSACPNNVASNTSHPSCLEEKTECCDSGVQEDEIVCAESVQVEKYDVASTCVPALDTLTCEVDWSSVNEDGEDFAIASSLHSDINAHQGMMNVEDCEPSEPLLQGAEPANMSEKGGVNLPSSKCEDVAASFDSIKDAQPVISGADAKGETDSSLHIQSDELMNVSSEFVIAKIDAGCEVSAHYERGANASTDSSCKIDIEEPCDDMSKSDTSQDGKVHTACMEKSREFLDGYDSQFEDGELRDANAHYWEANNCEDAEIEQVDYESECDGERLCILEAEDADSKRKFESGSSQGSGDVTEKSEQCAVGDAFGDSLTSSEVRTPKAANGNKIKKHIADCGLESIGKDFTTRVTVSRSSLSSDILPRRRSGNFDDLCPRSVRESDPNRFMERDRFALHMHRRSPGGGHIIDTRQSPPCHIPYGSGRPRPRSIVDSHGRRKYMSSPSNVYRSGGHIFSTRQSPPYHGSNGSCRPRPRSVIESREFVMASDRTMLDATRVEGFDSRVRRPINSSSNNVHQPISRRSLAYRDDIYGGTTAVRGDISPDRSRFRRYPLRDDSRGGIREEYCRPIPNYSTDDHMPHRLGRRERSISPLGGERLHCAQPYKKPQSRSRSRSPNGWFMLRERIEGSRRRSRSPTFRSARINNRVRLAYNKKRSEVEYEEGFMSPPRNRFSPQCNFRFDRFDERISGLDNSRDRKSPVRMFRQGQRFDSGRSFRPPMMHPNRRFGEMGGGAGRGFKYGGGGGDDDDRRKRGTRYEVIDQVRRYDTNDGVMQQRLRTNAEDSLVVNE